MKTGLPALALVFLATGCASAPPASLHYDHDALGHYYKTKAGAHLRVDADGTVNMIYDGHDPLRPPRILGRVSKTGEGTPSGWDLAQYDIEQPSGACTNWFLDEPGVSCRHLVWQIPAVIIGTPLYVVYKAVEMKLGILQLRERHRINKDTQTCKMQECSEDELGAIETRETMATMLDTLSHVLDMVFYVPGANLVSAYVASRELDDYGLTEYDSLEAAQGHTYGSTLDFDAMGRPFIRRSAYGANP